MKNTCSARLRFVTLAGSATLLLAACGSAASAGSSAASAPPSSLRLGYLTNLTHAPALIGVTRGYFQSSLPAATTLQTKTFSAGPAENEALLGGSLDAAFVGPSPAIKAFTSTHGGVVVVAGAASGGAGLVVSPDLAAGSFPQDLKGQTLASPQLGNTQDVALRTWLSQQGLTSNVNGGGDVSIDTTSGNAVDLQRFVAHQIAGGWEPEPYESLFVVNGHGKLVVDEASLWPGGLFPTTLLVVTKALLTEHPDIVNDLLQGLVKTIDWIHQSPSDAASAANTALSSITGAKPLSATVLAMAWSHLTFSVDPLASALQAEADHAKQVGLLSSTNLGGILSAGPLNAILAAQGKPTVSTAGLG